MDLEKPELCTCEPTTATGASEGNQEMYWEEGDQDVWYNEKPKPKKTTGRFLREVRSIK